MSGPNSKRTDVSATLRLCRGIASLIFRPARAPRLAHRATITRRAAESFPKCPNVARATVGLHRAPKRGVAPHHLLLAGEKGNPFSTRFKAAPGGQSRDFPKNQPAQKSPPTLAGLAARPLPPGPVGTVWPGEQRFLSRTPGDASRPAGQEQRRAEPTPAGHFPTRHQDARQSAGPGLQRALASSPLR